MKKAVAYADASSMPAGNAAGLTSSEARERLQRFGANGMPDTTEHPWRRALEKFWAPVPWMLEAAIVLELALGKYVEAAVIAGLLAFNAVVSLVQEGRAQHTLAALKARLSLTASVRRDGVWVKIPAADLVPGDIIKLSLGGVVPADARLIEGNVLLDQSMLTGESVPIDAGSDGKLMPALWFGEARLQPRSLRPAVAQNSVALRSWSAPPMSSAPSSAP